MKNWQKAKTRPNPDTLKAACSKYQNRAVEADSTRGKKKAKWESICEELSAETMLTQFCKFYQQMEGNAHTKTTSDLEDTNRARPMKRKVKLSLGKSYNRATKTTYRKGSMYRVISTEHLHKVAPTMNSVRRNSVKPLEEAGRIQHLVQIGFDTRISRTQKKRIGLGCTLSTKNLSKILEKVVLIQLKKHLSCNNLFEIFQSAYR